MNFFLMIIFSSLIGVLGAIAAKSFFYITNYFSEFIHDFSNQTNIHFIGWGNFLILIIGLTLAYIFVFFIRKINNKLPWYGPPDLIEMTHIPGKDTNLKSGLLSTFSALISICGGASVGQYGPLVVFGSSLGLSIGKLLRFTENYKDILIAAGAASAISAAFSAPIGGIIFAHEVILRHYGFSKFVPVTISSVISYFIGNLVFGIEPLFPVDNFNQFNFLAFLALVLTGISCGIGAVIYVKSIEKFSAYSNQLSNTWAKAIICIGVVSLIGSFIPQVLGLGTGIIKQTLSNNLLIYALFLILIAKLLITGLCLGFGFYGGIFSPALFVGAIIGGIIYKLFLIAGIDNFQSSEFLVIAGAAGLIGATIGGPLSAIFIILEMTQNHVIATQVMISIIFSSLIYRYFMKKSIFDRALERRGLDISLGREEIILSKTRIDDIMDKEFIKFSEKDNIRIVKSTFENVKANEGFVIDQNGILLGFITAYCLFSQNDEDGVEQVMIKPTLILKSGENILKAIGKLSDFIGEGVPVVNEHNILIGVIPEASLLQAYTEAQDNVQTGTS